VLERTRPDIVLGHDPRRAARDAPTRSSPRAALAEVECRFVRREIDLDPRVFFGATAE